ncbi:MAG TPA: helix-turn-helix transcriptional regulator, partial [Myxococcota bacterium]|nr:helix-turn-helix transcriptional regulator [Myxococcota bacterium]
EERDAPQLTRLTAARLAGPGARVRPLAIALVAAGRASVHVAEFAAASVEAGSLLLCRSERPLRLAARHDSAAEVLLLEFPARWLQSGLRLAGAADSAHELEHAVLDAGRPAAIELARALREAWASSQLDARRGHALEWTARWLAIAGRALDATGAALDADSVRGTSIRRGCHRSVLATLVRLAADRDGIPPSLRGLAEVLGLSERQTSRLFRGEMGLPFREYAAQLRVERAKRLLERGRDSVTSVALSSGWSSLSQFNAAFRKHTGSTPGAYRRRHQYENEYSIENEKSRPIL